jgi:ferrous iron transport protein A
MPQTLRSLDIGQTGTVKAVTAERELKRRILDMGIIPGARLNVLGRAPLRDPVSVEISGFVLALRKAEAEHILVEREERHVP